MIFRGKVEGRCLVNVGMLVAFYVVGIVLIDVVTDRATPSVDSHDRRLALAQIVKERASGSAALTGDY